MSNDPVEFLEDGWYFWDETWSDKHGPFETEKQARARLKEYFVWLETGKPSPDPTEPDKIS